jgi:hypothetical protein
LEQSPYSFGKGQDKYQNTGFFFLDSYFRDKKELVQPNLVGSFWLARGYKYQFFIE